MLSPSTPASLKDTQHHYLWVYWMLALPTRVLNHITSDHKAHLEQSGHSSGKTVEYMNPLTYHVTKELPACQTNETASWRCQWNTNLEMIPWKMALQALACSINPKTLLYAQQEHIDRVNKVWKEKWPWLPSLPVTCLGNLGFSSLQL